MRYYLLTIFISFICSASQAQTGIGLGIYPTGTETGLGLRLNKDKKFSVDARVTRATFNSKPGNSSFLTELSGVYRVILLEKVRFHLGAGFRADWNLTSTHKYGVVAPIGVEAFPFPFQNAELFFEAAPYYVYNNENNWQAGLRTVAGFVFYFPTKKDK